jgi:hypothetical protein
VFEQRAEHGQEVQVEASRTRHEFPLSSELRQIVTYSHMHNIISADD